MTGIDSRPLRVTLKETKRCPVCQKMILSGATAIMRAKASTAEADRPVRPRWEFYHPRCFTGATP